MYAVWHDGAAPSVRGRARRSRSNARSTNAGRRRHRRPGVCVGVCIFLSLAPSVCWYVSFDVLVRAWIYTFFYLAIDVLVLKLSWDCMGENATVHCDRVM